MMLILNLIINCSAYAPIPAALNWSYTAFFCQSSIPSISKPANCANSEISNLKEQVGKPVGSLFDGWVYSSKSGWIYTSPKIYPYAFSQNEGWLKYELGTDPRRVFYFKEDAWKVLNKKKNNKSE